MGVAFYFYSFEVLTDVKVSSFGEPVQVGDIMFDVQYVANSGTPGCEPECYSPSTATISVGGTVTFDNTDTAPHTATSGSAANGPDGIWDSSLIMVNASYSVTLSDSGNYSYFCMVHPWMEGTVIVE